MRSRVPSSQKNVQFARGSACLVRRDVQNATESCSQGTRCSAYAHGSAREEGSNKTKRKTYRPPEGPSAYDAKYDSIDKFENLESIYEGAVSTVYHARCTESAREVVLKQYHKQKMSQRNHMRVQRELKVQRELSHAGAPHVCQLLGSFEDTDSVYCVLERCDGGDLFQLQYDCGGLLSEEYVCIEVIVPLLRALANLHAEGWIHRDIKPENIFLTHAEELRLGDFGLSINYQQEQAFHLSGTLDYLAPEMLRNPTTHYEEGMVSPSELEAKQVVPYGPAIDIWAVGVLAYELVTGISPFADPANPVVSDRAGEEAVMHRILGTGRNGAFRVSFPVGFSAQWTDFVRIALEPAPESRPPADVLLEHPWIRATLAQRGVGRVPDPTPEKSFFRTQPAIAADASELGTRDEADYDTIDIDEDEGGNGSSSNGSGGVGVRDGAARPEWSDAAPQGMLKAMASRVAASMDMVAFTSMASGEWFSHDSEAGCTH